MAKRYIETGFFKSPFVRGLKGSLKTLYTFIICDCEGSGIWTMDMEVASLYTGFKYTIAEFKKEFIDKGKAIDLKNGKYFFPDFIDHQYPKGLSETNPAHNNFIRELLKYNLLDNKLKPLRSPLEGTNVMVTVMEKAKEKVKPKKEIPTIAEFMEHAQDVCKKAKLDFDTLKFSIKAKYDSWVDAGWKTGHGKSINNWKTTFNNTLPHLKPITGAFGKKPDSQVYDRNVDEFRRSGDDDKRFAESKSIKDIIKK